MRKLVLLAAAVPLLWVPTALAAETKAAGESVCRPPDVDIRYAASTFTFLVVLPVEDCASRRNRTFNLQAAIVRHDPDGGFNLADASTPCGPYRSDHDDSSPASCALAVTLNHPEHETGVRYDLDATHDDAVDPQTFRTSTVCSSNRKTVSCDNETP